MENNEKSIQNKTIEKHDLSVHRRAHTEITGVVNVVSFDEESVTAVTDCGEICIEGEKLCVVTLDTDKGIMEIDGRVNAVIYADNVTNNRKKRR